MEDVANTKAVKSKMKDKTEEDDMSDEELDSEDEDETIARIQRAHFAQAAAMSARRRSAPRPRPMSAKRKMEAVKNFHDFTKKLKKDTGIAIRSLVGNNVLELSDFSSEGGESDSDGLSEEEFVVNPSAVQELNEEDESYIDPETGDIVTAKKVPQPTVSKVRSPTPPTIKSEPETESERKEEPKTLSISDIINDGDLDLSKNVEIAEIDQGELCPEKTEEELLDIKQEETSQDFDITEKLKEMGEISVKPVKKEGEEEDQSNDAENEKEGENDDEKKSSNPNALNVRRNIREVMDEKNLDASTLAAQRQESERLARVQEQQRIIREVQRQIAINRQNKIHQKTMSLLQGGSSILKQSSHNKLNLPNTVLVKLPSGETKKTTAKQGQVEVTKLPTTSGSVALKSGKPDHKTDKKEVVEIVDSSSGEETSSSSSDSDDCIMLSDSEVPPSPEADEDPNNSGLHVNDTYNVPDEQGRVLINIGHPETEEDIFLAPQIARVIKPHQIGGVRFLFDNIIESVERFSTSTGFGCILAHSMGLGKTLQIVCFCDIFLRHTTSKTVLCIMPINTLQNWVAEFNMWLPLEGTTTPLAAHGEVRPRNFPIYVLNDSHKTLQMRAKVVKDWTTTGGVLMIGYELYRLLSMKKDKKPRKKRKADAKLEAEKEREKEEKKLDGANEDTQNSDITNHESKLDDGDTQKTEDDKKDDKKEDAVNDEEKKLLDEMFHALVKPGPDLVICDEGHRIKNSHSNISYALKQMRTKRRVVLTGYPLQNNLLEYWCMVDFVRPNYLGSKTEFCNMFERPIQNGQCIDSTPQDIRLMRYRAHVLHSLLVGFVQRRSHAVLQSTLPQKEEYVLLVRMTPLQRKLYDRFMNEVVRSTSVPNPLKAFAICCKIWNHPDVLYNFLKKRSEANAAIEEDLDLEELRGVTKSGRARNSKGPPRRGGGKTRGASKKPAATIQPNTTTGPTSRQDPAYSNTYPPNGPYGPPNTFRPDQPGGPYPPYSNYQNPQGYYPPNQGYNQNYDQNYYQQQPPYGNNYPNEYPQNNPEWNQGYNQNNWGNGNYYGNSGYYNNPQYPNGQPPPEYRGAPPDYSRNPSSEYPNSQQYPPNYNAPPNDPAYPGNAIQPYPNNQDGYGNQQRPPYQGPYNTPGYPEFNANNPPGTSFPNNQTPGPFPNNQTSSSTFPNTQPSVPPFPNNQTAGSTFPNNQSSGPAFPNNQAPGPSFPSNQAPGPSFPNNQEPGPSFPNNQAPGSSFPNNQVPEPSFPNNQAPAPPFPNNQAPVPSFPNNQAPVPSFPNSQPGPTFPSNQPIGSNFPNNQAPGPSFPNSQSSAPSFPNNLPPQEYPNQSYPPPYEGNSTFGSNPPPVPYNQYENQPPNYPGYTNVPPNPSNNLPNQSLVKSEPTVPNYPSNDVKQEPTANTAMAPYSSSGFNYNQPNTSAYPDQSQNINGNYPCQYPNFPPHLETKPPMGSAGSGSPITSWPITELKTEIDKLKAEEKIEMKSESDGEVKIEDLDTKKIVKDETKKEKIDPSKDLRKDWLSKKETPNKKDSKTEMIKSDGSESEEEAPKKGRPRGRPKDSKNKPKGKSKPKPRGRKDRKTSKDKNNENKNDSESEESEKDEKPNREEELALMKKAEEVTYDWAAELLKDYIPGIIENSAKMELFFYILNESIKMGDRILLFSQSLFTLNLIEDFLERNYIPGTSCLWERNTNYYRLDGSTHALEREKLINEFNTNPHIYLFLVSTRAGSLGINLVGANRVIVFDASWNPCHDTQAVCRVYRYGQKKPCFVYRFVMDWCLEKKIYDRQINKQGMADRVVDECNPDAVLSMKEITNLCFDNDEKESEPKDLSEHKDRYLDVIMQGILVQHGTMLSKEPFQHESLLVDRKEKKLSSAEKRLAQRGYELEKKAALAPKPTTAYRTVRAADGSLVQRPVASVRPMQHGARWIPADVWRRQGMTAQEMTLPLDVVIPTNSAEKTNIVLKAGQRVMVLKSPKGIYMQLESGKIIAIKTSLKGLAGGQKSDGKDNSPVGKKVLANRPMSTNIPGSLKNNSAITITSKSGQRPGFQRIIRPSALGQNKMSRPMLPGQKIAEIRNRLGEMRSYSSMRPKLPMSHGRLLRPGLPGSVSITKISKDTKKSENEHSDSNSRSKMDLDSEDETQVLDSDDEDTNKKNNSGRSSTDEAKLIRKDDNIVNYSEDSKSSIDADKPKKDGPIILTTDEKLPSEDAFDGKHSEDSSSSVTKISSETSQMHLGDSDILAQSEKKINLLKNYRHQRPGSRMPAESTLSQLEKTTSALNKEGLPDFRRNLDDITQSYSPGAEEKPSTKSKKKKSPSKAEVTESQNSDRQAFSSGMSHSVSSLLGNSKSRMNEKMQSASPIAPMGQNPRPLSQNVSPGMPHDLSTVPHHGQLAGSKLPPVGQHMMRPSSPPVPEVHKPVASNVPPSGIPINPMAPGQAYPAGNPPPEGPYGQYPGYGMGYAGYPNAPYYGGYGGAPYYPPYAGTPPAPFHPPAPPPDGYLPPNPQW